MKSVIDKIKKWFNNLEDSTKKIVILLGAVILIILFIALAQFTHSSDNFNNIKQDKSRYLVYSKVEDDDKDYPKYVPFINIKSNIINQVNEDIDNFVSKYLSSDKSIITYEYQINGILLSVVIKTMNYQNDYAPEIDFRSYNINLETRELISDRNLLDFFQISEEEVSSILETSFKNYYADLVNEGYYEPHECDYNCFLRYREIGNYLDNINYYIKGGNLIAYKPFVFYSIFGDEEYFKAEDFEFLLVETDKSK